LTTTKLLERSEIAFSEMIVEKELGEGRYGRVCLGKWNAALVALKFCKNKGKLDDFMKEIRLMVYVVSEFDI
jgi:predicted Ser/Thr protein kinase